MLATTKQPAIRQATMVWKYRGPVDGLNTAAQKSVRTALPSSIL